MPPLSATAAEAAGKTPHSKGAVTTGIEASVLKSDGSSDADDIALHVPKAGCARTRRREPRPRRSRRATSI